MLKGFRDFVFRGNIVDLAIAVVIGTAFTTLVKTFTDALILPLVNLFLGGGTKGGKFTIDDQVFDVGAVVNAAIFFLITAAVVYFLLVVPMRTLNELNRRRLGVAEEDSQVAPDIALLTEIRDLLASQPPAGPTR